MDGSAFDALARSFVAVGTRRRLLVLLAGLGLASPTPEESEAASSGNCNPACGECQSCNKGKCKRKNGRKKCKKGTCEPITNGTACTSLSGGVCCTGTCSDLQSDESNCGACGTACGPNQVCQRGVCFPKAACPANQTGVCAPITSLCGGTGGVGCACSRTTEDNVVCVNIEGGNCNTSTPCTTSASCPAGSACVDISQVGGCGCPPPNTKFCLAACPTPSPASVGAAAPKASKGGFLSH